MKPTVFQFDSAVVRTFADDKGEPWFNATDVCAVLGSRNPSDASAQHCREGGVAKREVTSDVSERDITSRSRHTQEMTFINEGNLYRLIIKSRKPEAARFEAWVCDEVLPTIRKTGSYTQPQATATVNGQISVEMAEYVALLKQQAELVTIKAQRKEAQSKAILATTLMRDGNYSCEEIAEIAGIDLHTVDYLFADLRRAGERDGVCFHLRIR